MVDVGVEARIYDARAIKNIKSARDVAVARLVDDAAELVRNSWRWSGTTRAWLDSIEPRGEDGDGVGEDAEPFCGFCGDDIGIFQRTGPYWMHYRGEQPGGPGC